MLFSFVLAGCDGLLGTKDTLVESVTLNKTTANVSEGLTILLTATVRPVNATNRTISWESSDEAVATVVGGVVTGKVMGTAVITAISADGSGKSASCTVTVTAAGAGDGMPPGTYDPKDEADVEDDGSGEKVQATVTVTGIPSEFVGKGYYFSIFPSGTMFKDLYETAPEGYGQGTISGTTITGQLFGAKAVSGSYLGVILIGSLEEPDFVGYTTVNIQGGKATIAATGSSGFTDVTADYEPPPEGYIPGGDGEGSSDPEPWVPPTPTLPGSITINNMLNGNPINGSVPAYTPLIASYSEYHILPAAYSPWQWNKGNVPIQGGTGQSYLPTEAGAYSVTLGMEGYQSITSAAVSVSDGSASNASLWALTAPITIDGKNPLIYDIAYGSGKWIAVGGVKSGDNSPYDTGAIAYSTDGINWTGQILSGSTYFSSVACDGNNTWVAVGPTHGYDVNNLAYSTDNGVTWTEKQIGDHWPMYGPVAYGGGKWLVCHPRGGGDGSSSGIYHATDPAGDWGESAAANEDTDSYGVKFFEGAHLDAITHNGSVWVVAGRAHNRGNTTPIRNRIARSSDGETWEEVTNLTFGDNYFIDDIAWGNGTFVVTARNFSIEASRVATSADGQNWSVRDFPLSSINTINLTWNGNKFVIASCRGDVKIGGSPLYYSADGQTWNTTDAPVATRTNDCPVPLDISNLWYGGGKWIASGYYRPDFYDSSTFCMAYRSDW